MERKALSLLLLLLLAGGLFAAAVGPPVCPPNPSRSYVDVMEDQLTHKIGVLVYNISGNYDKNPIKNGMVYRINLSQGSQPNAIVYGVTDNSGWARFDYDPNLEGCLDYWFVFCPVVVPSKAGVPVALGSPEAINRERCLNGTGLSQTVIHGLINRGDGKTNAPVSQPEYLLSHNEFYFCNHNPMDWAPFCWPLMLILGLLLGASFAVGRNPFMAFDMSSPRMNRGRMYTPRVQQKRFDALGYLYAADAAYGTVDGFGQVARGTAIGDVKIKSLLGKLFGSAGEWIAQKFGIKFNKEGDEEDPKNKEKNLKKDLNKEKLENLTKKVNEPDTSRVERINKVVKDGLITTDIKSIHADVKKVDGINPGRTPINPILGTADMTKFSAWNLWKAIKSLLFGAGISSERDEANRKMSGVMDDALKRRDNNGNILKDSKGNDRYRNLGWFSKLFICWYAALKYIVKTNVEASGGWNMVLFTAFMSALLSQSRKIGKTSKALQTVVEGAFFITHPSSLPFGLGQTLGVAISAAYEKMRLMTNEQMAVFIPLGKGGNLRNGSIVKILDNGLISVTDKDGNSTFWKRGDNGELFNTDANGVPIQITEGRRHLVIPTPPPTPPDKEEIAKIEKAGLNLVLMNNERGELVAKGVDNDELRDLSSQAASYSEALAKLNAMGNTKPFDPSKEDISIGSSLYEKLVNFESTNFDNVKLENGGNLKVNLKVYEQLKEFANDNGLNGFYAGVYGQSGAKLYGAIDVILLGMAKDGMLEGTLKGYTGVSGYDGLSPEQKAGYINKLLTGKIADSDGNEVKFNKVLGRAYDLLGTYDEYRERNDRSEITRLAFANANGYRGISESDDKNLQNAIFYANLTQRAFDSRIELMQTKETSDAFQKAVHDFQNMDATGRKERLDKINDKLDKIDGDWKKDINVGSMTSDQYSKFEADQKIYYDLSMERLVLTSLVGKKEGEIGIGDLKQIKQIGKDELDLINFYTQKTVRLFEDRAATDAAVLNFVTNDKSGMSGVASLVPVAIESGAPPGFISNSLGLVSTYGSVDLQPIIETATGDVKKKLQEFETGRNELNDAFKTYLSAPTDEESKMSFLGHLAAFKTSSAGFLDALYRDETQVGFKNVINYLKTDKVDLNPLKIDKVDLNPFDNKIGDKTVGEVLDDPYGNKSATPNENDKLVAEFNSQILKMVKENEDRNYNVIKNNIKKDIYSEPVTQVSIEKGYNASLELFNKTDEFAQRDIVEKVLEHIGGNPTDLGSVCLKTESYKKKLEYSTDFFRNRIEAQMETQLYGRAYNMDYDQMVNSAINDAKNAAYATRPYILGKMAQEELQETRKTLEEFKEKHRFINNMTTDEKLREDYSNQHDGVKPLLSEYELKVWNENLKSLQKKDQEEGGTNAADYLKKTHDAAGIYRMSIEPDRKGAFIKIINNKPVVEEK